MMWSKSGRVSDNEVQRILELIEEGKLEVGDRLPGQRELASRLGIGRSSVREAVRYLEAVGMLETRPGLGTFVVSDRPYSKVASSLSAWLANNKEEVLKVFHVREALEGKTAELAALHATEEDFQKMDATLSRMNKYAENNETDGLTREDYNFHDLIARASNNDLLYQIVENIQGALMESRRAVFSLPGRGKRSIAEHYTILEAIKESNPEKAKEAMLTHLENALKDVVSEHDKERRLHMDRG